MKQKKKIGVYGEKARKFQRNIVKSYFDLSPKVANVYLYMGSRDSDNPDINDIQNMVFFEIPDRAYNQNTVPITILMQPINESPMDFSRFGIINPIGDELVARVHMDEMKCLKRPLIVGDILEIPFYMKGCEEKAFFEVTDVDDKPIYDKFYYVIRMVVMDASRKTREIPVDGRSNTGIMDDVIQDMNDALNNQLPFQGFEENDEPVDFRNKTQKSFMDDPNMGFDEEK